MAAAAQMTEERQQDKPYTKPNRQVIQQSPEEMLVGTCYFLHYASRAFTLLGMTPKCAYKKGIQLWPFLTNEYIDLPVKPPSSQLMPSERAVFISDAAMLYGTLSLVACETTDYDRVKVDRSHSAKRLVNLGVRPVHLYFFLTDMLAIFRLTLHTAGYFTVDMLPSVREAFIELSLRNCDLIVASTAALLHFKEATVMRGSNKLFVAICEENLRTKRPGKYGLRPTRNWRMARPTSKRTGGEEVDEENEEDASSQDWIAETFNVLPTIESLNPLVDAHLYRMTDTFFIRPSRDGKEDAVEAYCGVFPGRRHQYDLKHWTFDPKLDVIGRAFEFWATVAPTDVDKDFRQHIQSLELPRAVQTLAEERLFRIKRISDIGSSSAQARLLFKSTILPILTARPPIRKGEKPSMDRVALENSLLGGWLTWFLNPNGLAKILEERPELASSTRLVELV